MSKDYIINLLSDLSHSTTAAKTTSGITLVSALDYLFTVVMPQAITMVCAILGGALSAILIYNQYHKGKLERQELENRIKMQEKELGDG